MRLFLRTLGKGRTGTVPRNGRRANSAGWPAGADFVPAWKEVSTVATVRKTVTVRPGQTKVVKVPGVTTKITVKRGR
jgi:hypothetical protein